MGRSKNNDDTQKKQNILYYLPNLCALVLFKLSVSLSAFCCNLLLMHRLNEQRK